MTASVSDNRALSRNHPSGNPQLDSGSTVPGDEEGGGRFRKGPKGGMSTAGRLDLARLQALAQTIGQRGRSLSRAIPAALVPAVAECFLIITLAALCAGLFWTWARPMPGILDFATATAPARTGDGPSREQLFVDFNPFHRDVLAQPETGGEDAPETLLDLKLYGVRAGEDPTTGSAIIRTPDHAQGAYWVGDTVLTGVTVTGIYQDRVVLARRGTQEVLLLDKDKDGRRSAGAASTPSPSGQNRPVRNRATRTPATANDRPAVARSPAGPDSGSGTSRSQPGTNVRVTEQAPSRQTGPDEPVPAQNRTVSVEDGKAVLRLLSLKPRIAGNGMNGMYIRARGDATIPSEWGIEPGDILISVSGIELTSPQRLEKVQDRIEDASQLRFEIERGGKRIPIEITLDGK